MGRLLGWFEDLLGAAQGAHVPAAHPAAPSVGQAGKGHLTVPSVLLEDFRAVQGRQRAPGAGSALLHLFLFGWPSPRPGSRWEDMDWAGAGTACAHAGLSPRRSEACFSEIQGEKLPLVYFSRHGGRRRESRVFLM